MYEFDTVSSTSPADLARSLTQRSADGWEVVSIVGSGLEVTAFVRRSRTSATTDASASLAGTAPTPVEEPAGWGAVPAAASTVVDPWSSGASTPAAAATPTTPEPASVAAPAATSTSTVPQVPAGWYADPAGRYELRYWDGSQWTEHVARGGTQYTDPPVA